MAAAIVVFSHLRWDTAFQRAQHVLTRLARYHPVVYIEEPVYRDTPAFPKTVRVSPNIVVCQPQTPVEAQSFHDDQLPYLQELVRQVAGEYEDHIAWFHTPMALPLLQELKPRLVVYECMDDLALRASAPKQFSQREGALLKTADIVFTAGPALHGMLRERHPNIHCVPSSVDAAHFLPALDRTNSHPAHRGIPGPRLGFHGVIDEHFDTGLVAALADAHAQWQIVLAGPVVNVDPASLPQRPNIHYLGPQPYEALPLFLAGWDVCLLPFAINDASRALHPVETLEYMAAELPIVSTPITDVANMYRDTVVIASDEHAFIAACEAALLAAPEQQAARAENMRGIVSVTSWDETVERMRRLMEKAPRRDRPLLAPAPAPEAAANVNVLRQQDPMRYARTAIVGAGPTGLAAGYHLGHDAVLFDRNAMVGGHCSSRDAGFTFDHAAHLLFSQEPDVLAMYERLLGSNIHWQECVTAVHDGDGNPRSGEVMRFAYPLRGGVQALLSGFVPHIKGTIELNAEVVGIIPAEHRLALADGRRYEYHNLVSTMPLPELLRLMWEYAPNGIRRAAGSLRHLSRRRINVGVEREHMTDKHWMHFPEGFAFHRVFVQGNASTDCNAPGGFCFSCEIDYDPGEGLPASGRELIDRCLSDCVQAGLMRADDRVIVATELDIPYARAIHDDASDAAVALIKRWLASHDIMLAGPCSEWDCTDHPFIAGKRAALQLAAVDWNEPRQAAAAE